MCQRIIACAQHMNTSVLANGMGSGKGGFAITKRQFMMTGVPFSRLPEQHMWFELVQT
jgi:hypothetical protein